MDKVKIMFGAKRCKYGARAYLVAIGAILLSEGCIGARMRCNPWGVPAQMPLFSVDTALGNTA